MGDHKKPAMLMCKHLAYRNLLPAYLGHERYKNVNILSAAEYPVLLRYRICSTQSSGWFCQLTLFDPRFDSAVPFLLHPRGLSQSHTLCQPQQHWHWMNQCFHFSITTAMTTLTGLCAGCNRDFLIAQVCKNRDVFWRIVQCFVFLYVLQHMCGQVVFKAVKSSNE